MQYFSLLRIVKVLSRIFRLGGEGGGTPEWAKAKSFLGSPGA